MRLHPFAVGGVLLALLTMCTGTTYSDDGATATAQAVRMQTVFDMPPIVVSDLEPSGPVGLTGCDEMNWYRVNAGLPERFSALGWRESNCRNEDGVRTWCCHGYWQLYISLWIQDHRLSPRLAACGVDSADDVNSDTHEDKLRQACAAKAAYDVSKFQPWAMS